MKTYVHMLTSGPSFNLFSWTYCYIVNLTLNISESSINPNRIDGVMINKKIDQI
jgi:hypothetical protein